MKKSGIGWQRSALPSEHNHKKGRPRRGSPDFGLFFPVFPIFLGFLNDLFEGAGGVGALGDIHQELIQLGPHLLVHPKAGVEIFIIPERLDLVLHDGGRVDLGVADAGQVGIRIENELECYHKADNQYGTFLAFRPLTFVPIATSPVVPGVLTRDELDWLNAYHREVFEKLAPRLNEEERDWLAKKCAAIGA